MLRLAVPLMLLAVQVIAAEVDCPLEPPGRPDYRLTGGWPTYGGGDGGISTHSTRRGDIWHDTEMIEQWRERDGTLTCTYRTQDGRGRDIVLKVPGLMFRCDWLAQDVLKPQPVEPGTGGPIDHVFLRVWCTSRP